MAVLLRDLLQGDVEPVLLEDTRFLGERERRKAGPAGNADADLHIIGECRRGDQESGGQSGRHCECPKAAHCCGPLLFDGDVASPLRTLIAMLASIVQEFRAHGYPPQLPLKLAISRCDSPG